MKYGIGDTVFLAGCTRAYQVANPIVINHIKEKQIPMECDGEMHLIKYTSVSENGWSWYPITTVTKTIGEE